MKTNLDHLCDCRHDSIQEVSKSVLGLTSISPMTSTHVCFLAVGHTTALLAFTDNGDLTLLLWDISDGSLLPCFSVSPGIVVEMDDEDCPCLILSGFMFILGLSHNELLSRLMVHGSPRLVDSLCLLNHWERCSVPLHALEVLANFLKHSCFLSMLPSQPPFPSPKDVYRLVPALQLLHRLVQESIAKEATNNFAEELLYRTHTFLHRQLRMLLTNYCQDMSMKSLEGSALFTCCSLWHNNLHSQYLMLIPFLFSLSFTNPIPPSSFCNCPMPTLQDVVKNAIICGCIPAAQAWLKSRRDNCGNLKCLKSLGVELVDAALQQRDMKTTCTLISNLVINQWVKAQSHLDVLASLCRFLENLCKTLVHVEYVMVLMYMRRCTKAKFTSLSINCVLDGKSQCNVLFIDYDTFSADTLWYYLTSHHKQEDVHAWLENWLSGRESQRWPVLCTDIVATNTHCCSFFREEILDHMARHVDYVSDVFQASLANGRLLLSNQHGGIESMLLEGHTLLAAASLMYSPGGVDAATLQADEQLMKPALSPYPCLKAALFPQTSGPPCVTDISLYHLLQVTLFDASSSLLQLIFLADSSQELPNFSQPFLKAQPTTCQFLGFSYYLLHGRPSFAFVAFVQEGIQCGGISKSRYVREPFSASMLALTNFDSPAVVASVVAFAEMLGLDRVMTQVNTRVANTILQNKLAEGGTMPEERQQLGISSMDAANRWEMAVQFCQIHGAELSEVFVRECARDNCWLPFITFIHRHHYPVHQVDHLLNSKLYPYLDLLRFFKAATSQASPSNKNIMFQVLCSHFSLKSPDIVLNIFLLNVINRFLYTSSGPETDPNHNPTPNFYHNFSSLCISQDTHFLYLLQMFNLCTEHKDYHSAKDKLQLKALGTHTSLSLPANWLEAQASVLLLILIRKSETQYQTFRLYQLLSESHMLDFKKLSQLAQILRHLDVPLGPAGLQDWGPEGLLLHCVHLVACLQERRYFVQARQVAAVMDLPCDDIVTNELFDGMQVLQEKEQWCYAQVRATFWKQCHEAFDSALVIDNSTSQFMTCPVNEPSSRGNAASVLLLHEKFALLTLSGHWLGNGLTTKPSEMEIAEFECWKCRLELQHSLEIGKVSVSSAVDTTEDGNSLQQENYGEQEEGCASFAMLSSKYSFDSHSLLSSPHYLKLSGLSSSNGFCRITNFQEKIFENKVADLLDKGCVLEAARVCRYFGVRFPDLEFALSCLALASCEANVTDLPEHAQDVVQGYSAPTPIPRHRKDSCSLRSFVIVPSREDQVAVALETLTRACQHGKRFCQQVHNAYELSKELEVDFAEVWNGESASLLTRVLRHENIDRVSRASLFVEIRGISTPTVTHLLADTIVEDLARERAPGTLFTCLPTFTSPQLLPSLPQHLSSKDMSRLKPTVMVEVLILAHECFTIICHVEGIIRTLLLAKHLTHNVLVPHELYPLMVRLLIGIGRYTDMVYILDLLHQYDQFELLLKNKMDLTALLDYIKQNRPGDSEKYNMVALCFRMNREIAENLESAARTQLKLIAAQPWGQFLHRVSGTIFFENHFACVLWFVHMYVSVCTRQFGTQLFYKI
uniref:Spatacsin C-terminal domain-containing protein n=1 Tax=Eptatretus burgeri TaxID=7764 RepID=A0A8C4N9X5_EPTBU